MLKEAADNEDCVIVFRKEETKSYIKDVCDNKQLDEANANEELLEDMKD